MTYSEAKDALARSSWADCIIASLHAHTHSGGVSLSRGSQHARKAAAGA